MRDCTLDSIMPSNMGESRIGRVLVASLHQAIADLLPTRLEFYENWLNVAGLREGTIGLAPLTAVLSFLRTEGDAYQLITSARWRVRRGLDVRDGTRVRAEDRPRPARRACVRGRRSARHGALVKSTYPSSRALTRVKRGMVTVDLRGSLFCEVREASLRAAMRFLRRGDCRRAAAVRRIGACPRERMPRCRTAARLRRVGHVDRASGGDRGGGVTAALLALMLSAAAPRALPAAASRILVVPFETSARDGRTYWLGDAVSILIADDLNARGLGAIGRSARERAYEQLHLPPHAVLTRATVIKVGELVAATQIVVGEVDLDGDALTIRARPIGLEIGRAQPEVVERGDLSELFAVADRAARRAVPGGGAAAQGPTPSLQVFERYVKGLLAEQPAAQAEFLEAALRLDPGYDRARLALWEVRTTLGQNDGALAAVRDIAPTSPEYSRARFLSAVSLLALKQYDQAFTVFKALLETVPDASVWNDLGVIQLRRPQSAETGKPVYYFTKAAEAEPEDPDLLFNLGYAYALDKDPQAAIYWLREALRRNPADAEAHVSPGRGARRGWQQRRGRTRARAGRPAVAAR